MEEGKKRWEQQQQVELQQREQQEQLAALGGLVSQHVMKHALISVPRVQEEVGMRFLTAFQRLNLRMGVSGAWFTEPFGA